MGRKFSILVAFCVVLFGAILAGYWDMLDSQKLRDVRDQASASVEKLTGTGKPDSPAPVGGTSPATADSAPTVKDATGSEGAAPSAGASVPGQQTASDVQPSKDAPSAASPAADEARPVMPRFDVLRVEPDGSAVLAGRAAPNARIRLMDGATAIGTAQASPEGDFAVVLDDRLSPGDHQIRIEADKGDGVRAISEQTAIVSVPKPGDGGELLAMVETPNQPSRIINLPTSKSPPPAAAAAAPPPMADPKASTGSEEAAAPASAGAPPAAPEPETAVASREDAPHASPPATPVVPPPFAVEAVEIENGTIYVAGRAPGTAPVRVYVDNKFVGEDKARANDRFLVTAKVPLTVGNHEIRADMVGGDGSVMSRVEVPFAKPEGETMSAVASNDRPADDDQSAAQSDDAVSADLSDDRPKTPDPVGSSPEAPPQSAEKPAPAADTAGSSQALAIPAQPPAGSPAEPSAVSPEKDVATAQADESAPAAPPPAAGAEPPAEASPSAQVATIRQPPLEGVHTRVLIRRGDTLWRISRETYGAGRRYTVIYLANGDQIRNPNRIYPGQLFRLPKDETKAQSSVID